MNSILLEFEDISKISLKELIKNISSDPSVGKHKPQKHFQVDPRNGERIVYSEARAKRPHDIKDSNTPKPTLQSRCVVCEGKTTGIIDLAPTSEGFTFINKNLFPVIYPFDEELNDEGPFSRTGQHATGTHFLQWPSNIHDKDLDNMPLEDVFIVLKRLCALEKNVLHFVGSGMPLSYKHVDGNHYGYIGVIKNMGSLVGGSLVHGHHQIVHSNIKPRKILDDQRFKERWGRGFSQYLLRYNPSEYYVKEYKGGVVLLVPYFMKRPLEAMILFRDSSADFLHHLTDDELYSLGACLHDVMGALRTLMPKMGRELAYNWVIHEGDLGGMYVEILPWTQEIGGYEQLGIYLCQGHPESTTNYYRELIH